MILYNNCTEENHNQKHDNTVIFYEYRDISSDNIIIVSWIFFDIEILYTNFIVFMYVKDECNDSL